jgi:glutaconate CoA-transferase, subunit B
MIEATWKERMCAFFSREVADGDRVCSGAHTEISFAAMMLAQKLHAPNLRLQLGGTCYLVNVRDVPDLFLPRTSVDYRMARWAEEVHDHPETFFYFGAPGGRDYYEGDRPLTNGYFVGDKFFVGGLQADAWGNVNMIGLRSDNGGWALRGPGTVGICDIVTVRDVLIFLTQHDRTRLVEEVDFVSHPGPSRWRQHDFPGGGPRLLVTPLAVFDFEDGGRARLARLMPGVEVDEVRQRTGFEFAVADELERVPAPTEDELRILRTEIDRQGVLRQ